MTNPTKGANAGQFKKSSPRFAQTLFFNTRIHVLVYDREFRTWNPSCMQVGQFPKGRWISQGGEQPEVTCKKCLNQ